MNSIGEIFRAIAAFFGFAQHRSEERNSAEMKRAAGQQSETDQVSEAEKAVKEKDVDVIRKELAE